MTQPFLSIVMAHHEDFDGVYFTIQSLRMQQPHLMSQVEFVVLTNSPGTPHSNMVKGFLGSLIGTVAGVKFIEYGNRVGTSPSRNEAIAAATGKYFICMDCHVLLEPGALQALFDYYAANPDTSDLIQGPLIYDNLRNRSTHFNDVWRGEMWGTWGLSWRCPCGSKQRFWFNEIANQAVPTKLEMGNTPYHACLDCGKEIATVGWAGHESVHTTNGLISDNDNLDGEPFEIPGQGLGFFSGRKDAWLGFNKDASGFGGEEMYIHCKYRQAGHKALCMPRLGWLHRFGRPAGPTYPLTRWLKVRNYVLELQELGMDLQPVYDHFVATGLIGVDNWNKLAATPVELASEAQCSTCSGAPAVPQNYESIETPYKVLHENKRDLNEHMPVLRELATGADHVVEICNRREPTMAFLASGCTRLTSYNQETGPIIQGALLAPDLVTKYQWHAVDFNMLPDIEPCDVLFLDTLHRGTQLRAELAKYTPLVSRYIVIHDTDIYGVKGDDGGEGLVPPIGDLLYNPKSEWFVKSHTQQQYGLTVLGRRIADFPDEPVALVAPGKGPGTELKVLLDSIGVKPAPTCDCNLRAMQMDVWGVEMCLVNLEKIIAWLEEGKERWAWVDAIAAASRAVASGLAFKINWTKPIPSLVKLAIELAERKEENAT